MFYIIDVYTHHWNTHTTLAHKPKWETPIRILCEPQPQNHVNELQKIPHEN